MCVKLVLRLTNRCAHLDLFLQQLGAVGWMTGRTSANNSAPAVPKGSRWRDLVGP